MKLFMTLAFTIITAIGFLGCNNSEKKQPEWSHPGKSSVEKEPPKIALSNPVEEIDKVPPPPTPIETEIDAVEMAQPEKAEPELVETDGISLSDLIVARGVEKRNPVEPGTLFPIEDNGKIYAFLKVLNPEKQQGEVTISWAPLDSDKERGTVKVSIGAHKKWRTWAFTRTLRKAGKWQVIVRNAEGTIIGRTPFEMVESS